MGTEGASCDADGVIITGDLDRRLSRAPDYQAESQALTSLAEAMSGNPDMVLQRLVEIAVELTRCDSAGISLLEPGGEQGTFRWVATAGAWAPYRDGAMPREESPCGEVIARNAISLMRHPERAFPALLQAEPGIHEGLLAPFDIGGEPAGTVWAIKHSPDDRFEAEDARLLTSLARFAAAAHRIAAALRGSEASSRATEMTLREREARFRALATVGSSSVYRMSPDWREMHHLDGRNFLADTKEATTDWVDTYIPADERSRVREAISRAIAAKDVFELEHRVLRADGTVGWTASRAIPILDDAGEIVEWFGAATDVTSRVKADQSFTRLFRAAPAPFLVLKPDAPQFTIAEVNDAYLSATMRTRDELVGRGVFEAYPDNPTDETIEGVETLRASLERVLASREPDTLPGLKYDVARPDGTFEERWWSPVNSAVLGDNGEVEALIHNANDITDERRAAVALRESEARYRTLFETMGQGYALVELVRDPSGKAVDQRYIDFNPAIERLLGITAADAAGKLASEIFPGIEPSWIETFERVVHEGRPERFEQFFAPLGRWFEVYAYPAGENRFTTLYEDTTERKHAEDMLRESGARQAFLLKLSDALRAESNANAIVDVATRMLAEEMELDRCYAAEIHTAQDQVDIVREFRRPNLAPMPSQLRYSDYPEAAKQSFIQTLVFFDSANEPTLTDLDKQSLAAMSFGALISPPLRQGAGNPIWAMGAVSSQPRRWTPGEVALVEDVAERTWAAVERVHAEERIRESEARLTAAFESVPVGAAVVDLSGSAVIANADYRRFLPNGIIPSRDPVGGERWRGWDARGKPLNTTDFPGARAMRGERVVPGQEMLFTDDDGRVIWTNVATVPIRDDRGRVTGLITAIADIDAAKRAEQAIADSEARFRQFSDASTNILWIRDAETLQMTFASPAFDAIYGIPGPDRGGNGSLRTWARLIEPESRSIVLANFRRVRAGERIEMEFQVRRAPDGALRWIHNTDFPLRDAAGKVRWIAGLGADITDVKEAADRQGVLVAELQHRTRNLIAVVRSLSDRTLGNASSLDDFGRRFRLRLSALSRVQGLLSHLAAGERVTFDELLRSELTAHGATDGLGSKVTLDGPAGVPLRSGTVQTLALALHELATNASKYGALAASDGHLAVRWHVESATDADPPRLHVEWRESGVVMPRVDAAPRGGGYGRELIERALPYQLKARTSYELGADGVRCTIAVPISRQGSEGVDDE